VLVGAFVVILVDQLPVLKRHFRDMAGITVAMNIAVLAAAWLITRITRLNQDERVAISIEHLIRQEGTAIYIAVSIIGSNEMSLPMIINTPIALVLCIGFVIYARRHLAGSSLEEPKNTP
jgi:BASS family bile acid:Na+ symporter